MTNDKENEHGLLGCGWKSFVAYVNIEWYNMVGGPLNMVGGPLSVLFAFYFDFGAKVTFLIAGIKSHI